jgi:hypothetical protein
MRHDVRMDIDSVLRQRSKSYVNSILFLEYINNLFIPYLILSYLTLPYLNEIRDTRYEIRETEEFEACEACEACEAVLLIDNYGSHMSDDIMMILTRERVRIVIFAFTQLTYSNT